MVRMMNHIRLLSFSFIAAVIVGCGGGGSSSNAATQTGSTGSSSSTAAATGRIEGYLQDAPVSGMQYVCGAKQGLTGEDGRFECENGPVAFWIGGVKIAVLDTPTPDGAVYPQDLLGLDRANLTDARLIELTQFLQALDDDGVIDERITITQNRRDAFKDIEGDLSGWAKDGQDGEGIDTPSEAAEAGGLTPPAPGGAIHHLRTQMDPDADTPADTSDMSKYAGDWVGQGWGWEIRFKHTSGDFVSDTFGVSSDELNFDGEKIIMSLMVEHQTTYTLHIDENGQITGEGDIVYNLIPNLCGLNALATQVNTAVNLMSKMPEFFKLGASINKETVEKFVVDNTNLESWMVKLVKGDVVGAAKDKLDAAVKDMGKKLVQKALEQSDDAKKSGNVCSAAAGLLATGGGQSVGPSSLDEIVNNAKLGVAKALLGDIPSPASLILSVPGVTQVQYNYKGLQNGPETRYYTIKGYIENGKMYLWVDQMETPFDLVIEWQVNYRTETATFPVWSPFMDDPAVIYPAGKEVVTYEYVTELVEKSYTENGKKKTVTVPEKRLKAKQTNLSVPFAIFDQKGTHRNGKSMWHEYEYNWKAYRMPQ